MTRLRSAVTLIAAGLAGCAAGDAGNPLFEDEDPEAPIIERVEVASLQLDAGQATTLRVLAHDPAGRALSYEWRAEAGLFLTDPAAAEVEWQAPGAGGEVDVGVRVRNDAGHASERLLTFIVVSTDLPTVAFLQPRSGASLAALGPFEVTAVAEHPNGIQRVRFLLDGEEVHANRTGPEFTWSWDLSALSGEFELQVEAFSPFLPDQPGIAAVKVYVEEVLRP